jgi:uncharacterized SAM-binding protein YcdF (DUF218 family)
MIFEVLFKCIPLFCLPLGVAIALLLAALRWPRNKLLVAAPLVLLWIFGTPVISDRLMSSLEDRYPYRSDQDCPRADAVFVFGGMLRLRDHPGAAAIPWNEAAERFDRAVDLYKSGAAQLLVLSGGAERYPGGPDEGEILKARALTLGVAERAILVTPQTFNTEQEASALKQLAAQKSWKKVLVVTSAYHMSRAIRMSVGCVAQLIPVPVAYETPDPRTSWAFRRPEYYIPQAQALFISERALREYLGIAAYTVWRTF